MSKYQNRKVTVEGITFDSKKEANRYRELLLLERAGAITELKRQVRFQLLPPVYDEYERYSDKTGKRLKNGRRCVEKGVVYVADFTYRQGLAKVVEDVKGHRTKEYILKRKMMRYFYGIELKEI